MMRFYRLFFWLVFLLHLVLGGWLCLMPEAARVALHATYSDKMTKLFFQEHGLFLFIQACAYAYVAERPQRSIPVVTLATLVNACLALFTVLSYNRGDMGPFQMLFQLALSGLMLPVLLSYFVWFYHVPRPDRFMPLLGIFGERD